MAKALVNIVILCLIFSIISFVLISGNDDVVKAQAELEAAIAEAEVEAEAARLAAIAEAEEPDTSSLSFSTSAALSSDDYIPPDISAGKAPVNCIKGPWENDGTCNQNTGKQKQRREITPPKYGGSCDVSLEEDSSYTQFIDCEVDCLGSYDLNWKNCTVANQSCGQTGTEYKYFNPSPAQSPAREEGLVKDNCPATQTQPCYSRECVIGYHDYGSQGTNLSMNDGNTAYIGDAHNDRLSTLYIPENTWVQAYQHANYGGVCEPFESRGEPRTVGFGQLDNEVSSYKIGRGPTQPCPGSASPPPTSSGGYNAPAPRVEGWIDCENYDPSCRKYGCERDFEGDCLGTFSGVCTEYGLKGPNSSGDCYR